MGTRADFYIGKPETGEWIGSIALDGYPDGIANKNKDVLTASTEVAFREAVAAMLDADRHSTIPAQGWPWPWNDGTLTDFSYLFDDGKVMASSWGNVLFDPLQPQPEIEDQQKSKLSWVNMAAKKKVTLGPRSGLIVVER